MQRVLEAKGVLKCINMYVHYHFTSLMQKWCATQVEQFTKAKIYFGTTEMRTVAQAASINESGLYEIGAIFRHSSEIKVCRINITNNAINWIFFAS